MSPRVLFFLGLAMLAVAMVNAGCPCGGGVDACTCEPIMVRPPKIHKPIPVPRVICAKLNPPRYESSDPCCCKNHYVGVPPRPSPRCPSCYKDSVPDYPAPCSGPIHTIPFSHADFVPETPDYQEDPAPPSGVSCGRSTIGTADPVSLHLAYAAGLNRPINVKEGLLNYGFSKTPEYQPIKKEIMNIPEEKIAVVDKKILELRLPSAGAFDIEEEEIVPDEDDDFGSDPSTGLSYAELGYMPEKGKPCAWKPAPPCHSRPDSVVLVAEPTYSMSEVSYGDDDGIVSVDSGEERYSGSVRGSAHGCGGMGKCAGTCGRTCKACSY